MSLASARTQALRTLANERTTLGLGLLSWSVTTLLPAIHRYDAVDWPAWPLLALAPLVLLLGVRGLAVDRRAAAYLLLAGFPISLGLAAAQLEHEVAMATFSPWVALLCAACLLAFMASALSHGQDDEHLLPSEEKPLGEAEPPKAYARKQRIGLIATAVLALGGLLASVQGSWATASAYRVSWGEAGAQGACLAALFGGLATTACVALVGMGLRAHRGPPETAGRRARRVVWSLLIGVSGCVVYGLTRN